MKSKRLLAIALFCCMILCLTLTACKHTHTFTENADEQFLKSKATCTQKAVYYKSCSCGEKSNETFEFGDFAPHKYFTLKYSATQHWYECDCGAKRGEENHIPSAPATATTDQYCTKCNYVIVPALGYTHTTHTYDQKNTSSYYIKTEATCETQAVYYYSCKCGEKGSETFSYGNALGHNYGEWISNGNGTHTKTCANDSTHTVTENCSGGEATETQKAICSFCHGEYGELVDISDFQLELVGNAYAVTAYLGSDTTVTVPSAYKGKSVTIIDERAFYDCSFITTVQLPATIKEIGNQAFGYCTALKKIDIPSCTRLKDEAFLGCTTLTELTLPDGLVSIGENPFNQCTSLTKVTMNSGSISANVFANNTYLQEIVIGENISQIAQNAFKGCTSLQFLTLPRVNESANFAEYYFGVHGETYIYQGSGSDNLYPSKVTSYTVGNRVFGLPADDADWYYDGKGMTVNGVYYKYDNTPIEVTSYQSYYDVTVGVYCQKPKTWSMTLYSTPTVSLQKLTITNQNIALSSKALVSSTFSIDVLLLKKLSLEGPKTLYLDELDVENYTVNVNHTDGTVEKYPLKDYLSEQEQQELFAEGSHSFTVTCDDLTQTFSITVKLREFEGITFDDVVVVYDGTEKYLSVDGMPEGASVTYQNNGKTEIGEHVITATITKYGYRPLTLTATLTICKDTYTITYVLELDNVTNDNPTSYKFGEGLTLTAPTIVNYEFLGWYTDEEKTSRITMISAKRYGDITLYAKWKSIFVTSGTTLTGLTDYGKTYTEIEIPQEITAISAGALSGCNKLERLTIPFVGAKAGVTSSDTYQYPFGYIFGESSYTGGVKTEQYYYGDSTSSTTSTSYYIPSSLKSVTVTGGNILYGAFYNCSSLTNITIPDSVTSIGYRAFYDCSNLTSIVIPSGVTSIGSSAFEECSKLANITIEGTPQIGKNAFASTAYYDNADNWQNKVLYIDNCLIEAKTTIETCMIKEGTTVIAKYAFYGCNSLTSIEIPSSVTSIGYEAFCYCSRLTSVTFGKNSQLTSIGNYAFEDCSSLTSIVIPDSVTSIGYSAFSGCSSLEEMTIPFVGAKAGVTSSDTYQYPFGYIFGTASYTGGVQTQQYYCGSSTSSTTYDYYYIPSSLKSVTVTGGNILFGAFYNCCNLTSIVLPHALTTIRKSAFAYCNHLESIDIPTSVTSIGSYAFYNCRNLTTVTFGDNSQLESIGEYAFSGCSSLSAVYITDIAAWCNIEFGSNPLTYAGNLYLNGELVTELEIPSTVTEIKNKAFYNCSSLTSVTFGENSKLESIGKYAFYDCNSLTSITIPDRVTSIGEYAFDDCSSLTAVHITDIVAWCNIEFGSNPLSYAGNLYLNGELVTELEIPSTVTEIKNKAFYNCSSLTNITIPDSVTSIGYRTFYDCSNLTSIVIPSGVTSIGEYAFEDCSSLTIYCESESQPSDWDSNWAPGIRCVVWDCNNNEVADDGNIYAVIDGIRYALKDGVATVVRQPSNIISATIPSSVTYEKSSYSVTSIGRYAFYNCSSLTSITIPDSVTAIGSSAFCGCSSLTSIEIPSGVTSIGEWTFSGCSSLTAVHITGIAAWCNIAFSDSHANPLCCANNLYLNGELVTELEIPSTVTEIKAYAFYGCSSLTSIVIPSSVTSIGEGAFKNCSNLTSIKIPNSVTSIDARAFEYCSSLTNIVIPDSVTSIGNYAFYYGCSSLTIYCEAKSKPSSWNSYCSACPFVWDCNNNEVANDGNIYAVIDKIRYALKDGVATVVGQPTNIVSATIPSSVAYKGTSYSVTSIGAGAFTGCSSLTSIVIPDSVTSIGYEAFYNCSSLTSITIPDSVTAIGSSAFCGCSSLTTVMFGENSQLESIGNYAFYDCSSLTSIVIPDSVTSIGYRAFEGCSNLTSVTFGENSQLASIGSYTFYNCSSLTSIEIPSSVTSIGNYAFSGCSRLTSITIPSSVASIGEDAFYNCSSLTSVVFGKNNSLEFIGNRAFCGCNSLASITIPDSVTSIGEYAFSGCSSLTSIKFEDTTTWYRTTNSSNWENRTDGTQTSVTNISNNATLFTDTYRDYYWYKK